MPVVLSSIFLYHNIIESILDLVNLLLFYLVQLVIIGLINLLKYNRLIKRMTISIFSMAYIFMYFIIFTNIYTENNFSLSMFIFNIDWAIIGTYRTYGLFSVVALLLLIVVSFVLFYLIIGKDMWNTDISSLKSPRFAHNIITSVLIMILVISLVAFFTGNLDIVNKGKKTISRFAIPSLSLNSISDNSTYSTDSRRNIVLLQLESLNSIAVKGDFSYDGINYQYSFTPNLNRIARDGVYYPEYYSNGVRTNRAQSNFFCGTFLNINRALSYNPERLDGKCLPRFLKDSGYRTIVFRADDFSMSNTGNFMKEIGFSELHRDDIMQENDTLYPWSYDDMIFYRRVMDYLDENLKGQDGLFIYIEVVAHHYPFTNYLEDTTFRPPLNSTEWPSDYLNSLAWQDRNLAYFYDRFKKFRDNNTHLLIIGDHTWPIYEDMRFLNSVNAKQDTFVTSALWVPAPADADEFNIGKVGRLRFSHTDLVPTIFGVLNDAPYQNSFAFDLKNTNIEENYEDCHVLVQPHSSVKIAVVKNNIKYLYNLETNELVYFDLSIDPQERNPIMIEEKLHHNDFLKKYLCRRYSKYLNPQILSEDEDEKPWYISPIIVTALAVLCLFILLDYFFIYRKYRHLKELKVHVPSKKQEKQLDHKVLSLQHMGHSRDWVKRSLKEAGWKDGTIEKHTKKQQRRKQKQKKRATQKKKGKLRKRP
jgi:hypothetical protein